MTAPQETKEKTAAIFFAGFMTLALGGAGLLVAALAVGIERTWNRGGTERSRAKERGQGWLDTQRSWLDADHAARVARQRERQAWLEAGADPAKEPAKPRRSRRAGSALRRLIAQIAVAGSDFASGVRDGFRAGNKVRKNGGGFREIAAARPTAEPVCADCKRQGIPVADGDLCADCAARVAGIQPAVQPTTKPQRQYVCRGCGQPGELGYDGLCAQCRNSGETMPRATAVQESPVQEVPAQPKSDGIDSCPRCGGPVFLDVNYPRKGRYCPTCDEVRVHKGSDAVPHDCPSCGQSCYVAEVRPRTEANPDREIIPVLVHRINDSPACPSPEQIHAAKPAKTAINQNPVTKGDTVTAETATTATPAPVASATESNATILRAKLQGTQGTLHRIAELTDQLAKERTALDGQVRESGEFAQVTGQSAQARIALDEASALSSAMGQQLGDFSQGAVSAEDQMRQASDGLRVAENAEDELRSAGADGRAVAPAGANA